MTQPSSPSQPSRSPRSPRSARASGPSGATGAVTQVTHYDRRAVAARIHDVLGERPSYTQMVKASIVEDRPIRMGRIRLTAGMPGPDPDHPELGWRVRDIEDWLAHHPRLELERVMAELARAYANDPDRAAAVHTAKEWGLSWAQIADVISTVQGRSVTRQAIAQRYGTPTKNTQTDGQ